MGLSSFFFISLIFIIITISSSSMAASVPISESSAPAADSAAVYIVYTDRPQLEQELETFHLRTLSSLLGSEEAAKGALLYTYKHAASGFSAKLTPHQVEQLSKLPGVLQVVESRTMKLHDSHAKLQTFKTDKNVDTGL